MKAMESKTPGRSVALGLAALNAAAYPYFLHISVHNEEFDALPAAIWSGELKKTITRKLFLIQLLTSLVLVSGMYAFVQWSFDRGFIRYVEQREQQLIGGLSEQLAADYAAHGGWESLRTSPRRWLQLVLSSVGHPVQGDRFERILARLHEDEWPPKKLPQPPPGLPQPLELRIRLLDAGQQVVYGRIDEPIAELKLYPISNAGAVVGYLGMRADEVSFAVGHDLQFAEQQNESFLLIALVMLVISTAIAMPLARYFVNPIRAVTNATRRLATGDYSPRIIHKTDDELGQLARDFNELAHALSRNEALRRQWVADISHELRTPVTVLRGEIEAIRDGAYALNTEAMESLHEETLHLSRLIDDLYELSMSDIGALDYYKVPLDLGAATIDVLEGLERVFEAKSIRIESHGLDDARSIIHADPDRIAQLLSNLLQNSLRYTDDGGLVRLTVGVQEGRVRLTLEDSAPSVSDQDLPRLFDRLYRADSSRNRKVGGTGLGLAICRNIVEAHEGTIVAEVSTLGGLCIRVELPLSVEAPT